MMRISTCALHLAITCGFIASAFAQSTQGVLTSRTPFFVQLEKALGPQLEPWVVVSSTTDEVRVSTTPTRLASGLCRSFLLHGAVSEGRAIFDDPRLLEQTTYFYYMPPRSRTRDSSATDCANVPFDDYFEVRVPIEEGTLVELVTFLLSSVVSDSIRRDIGCESLVLRQVRVESFGSLVDIDYHVGYRSRNCGGVSLTARRSKGTYLVENIARVYD